MNTYGSSKAFREKARQQWHRRSLVKIAFVNLFKNLLTIYLVYILFIGKGADRIADFIEYTWNLLRGIFPEIVCYLIAALLPVWGLCILLGICRVAEMMSSSSDLKCPSCSKNLDSQIYVTKDEVKEGYLARWCPYCGKNLDDELGADNNEGAGGRNCGGND